MYSQQKKVILMPIIVVLRMAKRVFAQPLTHCQSTTYFVIEFN